MNSFRKSIFALACSLLLHIGSALAANDPGKPAPALKQFLSPQAEGLIGVTEDFPVDNPADNIFHVTVDETLRGKETVWLVYDLDGVQDHTAVSRSINDQLAVGGYLVRRRRGWATQREQIHAASLRKGDNIIRFTMPEHAGHSYRIRNLRIEVAGAMDAQEEETRIIFNQPSLNYYFDKAYIKGLVAGNNYQTTSIKIDGNAARMFNGEFEAVVDFSRAEGTCSIEVEAIHADGTTTCHTVSFEEPLTADFTYALDRVTFRSEKYFDAGKEATVSLNGAALHHAAGALKENAMLSITSLRAVDIPSLDAGMVNVTKGHAGFRFLPHGMNFQKEVNIRIPYDLAMIPDGYTVQDIRTYYFDEQSHHWVPLSLDTVLSETGEVVSKTVHFTDMINGIIKVPESPEVSAYNSTSMKGIKAANPTAGINLINPPQANNTGNASLGFTINMPPGRVGMQPQLGVNYNSGGGNGWMGLGWNLTIPMISIDTRWGVPRYDPELETETYTMNGEQLTPVAHRGVLRPRESGGEEGARFYPRVEGAFSKIVRRGDAPDEYYWIVTDKSGTKYFYGGSSSGFESDAVLRTDEGSSTNDKGDVAQWCLREVRDLNGNTVRYHYVKVPDAGVAGSTVMGYQIYIDKITYTGHDGSDGPYVVKFTRESGRQDKMIMANLGFKQVTGDRLKSIDVGFKEGSQEPTPIRSYVFNYVTGEFYKSLLENVVEYDTEGNEFYRHAFEYYNEVRDGEGLKPLEESAAQWNIPDNGLREKFAAPESKGFSHSVSALSGTRSKDFSAGLSVSVGPASTNFACKSLSVGGNYSYSQSTSEGILSLMDINGDGLSDKVYLQGNDVKYHANLGTGSFSEQFGLIKGLSDLYREKSKTNSTGFEANAGCKIIGAAINKGWSWSTSTTSAYFADVNGDQLVDFVQNGAVRFNTINPRTGDIEFKPGSAETPNPIFTGAGTTDVATQTEAERLEAEARHPLHDVVKMWKAPFDGTIQVDAPVRLVPVSDGERDGAPVDGVRVSVQRKNDPLWSAVIPPGEDKRYYPTGLADIEVRKGDQIYFRVGSVDNGSFDRVEWSPVIEYVSDTASLADRRDANGIPIYRFDARSDFKLSAIQNIAAPGSGRINIKGRFEKPLTTDTVLVLAVRNGVDTVVNRAFGPREIFMNIIEETGIGVAESDVLSFSVVSNTNINWAQVKWQPEVIYVGSLNPEARSVDTVAYYPVPEYSMLPDVLIAPVSHKISFTTDTLKRDTIRIAPILNVVSSFPPFIEFADILTMSVKKRDTLLAEIAFRVVNGEIKSADSAVVAVVGKDDEVFVEFHVPEPFLAWPMHFEAQLSGDHINTDTLQTGVYTRFLEGDHYADRIFGPLYRGWGQFAWKSVKDQTEAPIVESQLRLSESLTTEPEQVEMDSPDDFDESKAYDPAGDQFIMLAAMGREQQWRGYDEYTYVVATGISSSRLGDDDLSAPSVGAGDGAFAINKITKSTSRSFTAGLSSPAGDGNFSASGNYSWTNGNSTVLVDYLDMNGDRYPDIVTKDRIQYTTALGGLQDDAGFHGQEDIQNSVTHSEGVTVAGSAILSRAEPNPNIKKRAFSVGSGQNSSGLNGNYASGDNHSSISWMDINGDGLPDRLSRKDGQWYVALNVGYGFATEEIWNFNEIQAGKSESKSAGLGVSFGNGSVNVGVSVSQSENVTTYALMDVNGDGLPDQVIQQKKSDPVTVRLNTGNGFSGEAIIWKGAPSVSENSSTSESVNGSFTIGILITPVTPVVNIYINPSGSKGHGLSREESKFADMDGDGFPDFIRSKNDGELYVYRSTIGRTNLLKSVQRPLGAVFALGYTYTGNTYEMPNGVWTLDSVKVLDGFAGDGVDSMLTTFEYQDGKYDRREREFYGFAKVITRTHDTDNEDLPVYTQVTQAFANDSYYRKGLLLSESMADGDGNKYVEKENQYELRDIHDGTVLADDHMKSDDGNAFPALKTTIQRFYEGQSEPGKLTQMKYDYDTTGNVKSYIDLGDDDTPEDDLEATITYHNLEDKYLVGSPESITVKHGGATLRKREASIDPESGNVTQIRQFLSEDEVAVYDLEEYDAYGNLKKITRPGNEKGQRLSFEYVYDNVVHTYTEKVSNSYGYSSEATYDYRFGQMLTSKDLNGNEITYELDNLGRVKYITGPYEQGGGNKTIEFEYHPEDQVPWALTKHYDPSDPQNKLETVIFVDGLGRVLQTKKDVAIYQGEGKADTEMMAVSGRVTFDAFGRTVSALYPVTEVKDDTPGDFNTTKDEMKPTVSVYDVLNRTLSVTLPDGAVTETVYGFGSDRDGNSQFSTKTTDANGKQTEQFTDVRGRVTAVKNYTSKKDIWTSFRYNAINEQVEATDDLGHTTFSTYDNFGRRTTRIHPDAGQTNYIYDLAGNLTQLETANLIKEGLAIQYTYEFERLTDITYPQNPENNVKYTYGEPGAPDNRAGRIVVQEDASGAQEFFYGPLGEVVKNIRTVVIPQHDEQTYTTQWEYDTWNRLTSMTYADGEKVTYNYNSGGLLRSMTGKKKGATFSYVNQLGYDKFEQRVYLEYGNGTKTTYTYEPDRRRLETMTAQTKAKRLFMDNVYGYDKVNNIKTLVNKAPIPSSNLMGGASTYSYDYDDLYRLITAEGSFKGSNEEHTYTLSMDYNSVGGITHKTQVHKKGEQEQKKTTYDLAYGYGETQPHAPIHIGDQTYTYDANGNQTGWTSDVSGQERRILWDEENRIRSIYDNGSQHHYVYDASGERVLKGKTTGQRIFVNGEWKAGSGQMGNYTVYVNPYLVLKSGGYTKHYYIEGQRIVSKLGGGWDNKNAVKAGGNKVDYVGKAQKVFDGIVKNLKFLGADGQILTAGKSGKVPPGQISGTGNVTEAFRYFYHPDHLGSTSYVTDASGEVYQHLEYFAFGETFVEEHSNTDRTPYLFNGKELDDETGLYYYGARYYDARTSIWQSVDPLAMKFPNISPYAFSANNPINFVDPDGRASQSTDGTDPVFAPRIRPTSGELNKSRFHMVNRVNPDGSVRQHHGVDILAPKGTSLKSALAGEVVSVKNTFKAGQYAKDSYGNFIIIKSEVDGEPVYMKYAHLDQVNVKVGDQISAGAEIGLTGNTGNAVGLPDDEDHVHIEASKGGDYFNLQTRINPEQFFETKFDSHGNPLNPSSLTNSEVNDIINFTNDLTNEQNFNDRSLPDPVSLPEL